MKRDEIKKAHIELAKKTKGNAVKFFEALKRVLGVIKTWIGIDGLINMQSCIIIVSIINIVLDGILAGIITLIIAVIKSCYDKYKKGHEGELHDFICCLIGVIIGIILSAVNSYFNVII